MAHRLATEEQDLNAEIFPLINETETAEQQLGIETPNNNNHNGFGAPRTYQTWQANESKIDTMLRSEPATIARENGFFPRDIKKAYQAIFTELDMNEGTIIEIDAQTLLNKLMDLQETEEKEKNEKSRDSDDNKTNDGNNKTKDDNITNDDNKTKDDNSVSSTTKNEDENEGATASSSSDTRMLRREIEQLKEEKTCKVCLDLQVSVAFLPCGHAACCSDCAPAMRKCPVCRSVIKGTVKIFL